LDVVENGLGSYPMADFGISGSVTGELIFFLCHSLITLLIATQK
jgi:hypothetical protein